MVSKPNAKAQAKRGKPKVENKKKRNATRGDAELFKAVIEHSHDAIIFLDSERKIFYASPSIAQIVGYEPEELSGKSGIEFTHPDDREITTRQFRDLLQNPGKSIAIEYRLKHKNGSWHWVDTTATNFLDHPQVQAVVLNMRDITERRKAEEALRASDERYRLLFSNSMDAVLLTAPDGSILEANPTACEMFGRNEEELIRGGRISIVDTADPRLGPALEERARTGKFKGELTFLRKDGGKFPGEISTQIFTDQSGQKRTSMVIRDITERIRNDEALRESEQRYKTLFDAAPIQIFTKDRDGRYTSSNAENQKYWEFDKIGYTDSELAGTEATEEVSQRDQRVIETGERVIFEQTIPTTNLGWRTLLTSKAPLHDAAGNIVGLLGASVDITERKHAEQALHDSEALYRQAIEVAGAVPYYESYYDNGAKIKYDFIGEGIRQITGYGPEEFTATLWDSMILDIHMIDELAGYTLDEAIQRVRLGESPIWKCEHRIRHRNGEIRWVFEAAVELRDEHGVSHGSIGMYQDITARKRAEQELRESEERFRSLSDITTEGIMIHDNGVVLDTNRAFANIFGFRSPDDLFGKNAFELLGLTPESRKAITDHIKSGATDAYEITATRLDGSLFPGETQGKDTVYLGSPARVVLMRDITERKQAENALREAEIKYRNLVERLSQVIYTSELGTNGGWKYVSPQIEKLLGFTPQEWLADPTLWYQQVHPEDRDIQLALEEQAYARNEPFEAEYRILTHDGKWIWIRDSGHIFPPQGYGLPIVQGTLTDVTERKQIEIKLHASEDILRSTIESPKEINIVSVNRDYEYLSFNTFHKDSMKQAYGIDVKNGMNLLDCLLADEERMKAKAFFDRALAGESHTSVEQYGTLNIYFWETKYSPIVNDENEIVGATAFSLNITERRQAEDNLRKAEAKYRMLVEQIPPIIYLALPGQNVGVTYISPQIKTLGFTAEEWVADPELWLRQIHPDDQAKVTEYIERISQSGEPYKLEYRLSTRAGVVRWFMDEVKDIVDETGNILFRQGFMLDITERKQSEEALSISKAQLLANLEHTPNVAVQWYDKDGRILYWNPASESMYGWKSVEALGKTLEQLIHTPEEQLEFMRILADIQATGSPFGPYEAQIRRKDGTNGWVLATTFSMPMPDGQLGFVCMDVDINERKQAEELIQRQLRRLNALHTIDMAINSSANLQITLEVLLGQTLSQLNADAADVLLFNQPAQTLELTASRGFRSNINLQAQQRLGDGFAGQVINARRTIHISDLMEAGKNLRQISMLANDSFTEYFGVPLIAKGQIKGVLEIYHRSPLTPEDDWLNFLEVLAGQAAIAIDNAQLVQGLQRSNMEIVIAYDATIEGWSRAMDLRDKETEGHTQRVTALTLKLARAMGIREADIIQIQRGGLLHDIGKLGVPDNILLKPGPLTDEEWAIMRQHPAYAFNMIAPVNYLKPALDIPYCHHEKWDGTGYPRGLQGEQIPLAARIFAVVDVWDALTSDRPYRPAWTKERTYEHILSLSGTHFDPKVVGAFTELRARGWQ